MINAIRFQIPNESGKYLFDILKDIDVVNYKWYVKDDEVYYDDNYEDLFDNTKITGKEILNKISTKNYYIINIQLIGYKENNDCEQIQIYDDFKNSKSEIMLCIYDSVYSEIYLKDRFLLEKIYNSLDEKNFNPIYITEKNIRNKISVF